MKILIIVGSADVRSHSLRLGRAIEAELSNLAQEVELINLAEYGLPSYDREVERHKSYDDTTQAFLDKSGQADAFVWITPIYHNSYSSTLKNALDWHHATKFTGKVVGLASNGGNRSPQAVDQLTLVARSQHMLTIPTRVCTDAKDYDESMTIVDSEILNRVHKFAVELIDYSQRLLA